MTEYICIGDYICLYSSDFEGYVFCDQSSSVHNGLWIHNKQDRRRPRNVRNIHTVAFRVCIQNRYKLEKKLRRLKQHCAVNQDDRNLRGEIQSAQTAAEAEEDDNKAEQRRQIGKRLKYGDIVQLFHIFTRKFVHVSTTQASVKDKNNMLISLESYNAKHAQFRVQPRYKVKSEGDFVQNMDQIVFESVKSPGNYFHGSMPFKIENTIISELNLGINRTGFTVVRSYHDDSAVSQCSIRGGSVVRLFHRELEAYLMTEGLFMEEGLIEDVFLRLRPIDQENRPQSLLPSTAAVCYWQLESEDSVLNGEMIRWGQQVRLRHLVTQQFLCVDCEHKVSMTPDPKPHTVFRLHPVKQDQEWIRFESFARIEHELTKRWLHSLKDEYYTPKKYKNVSAPGADSSKAIKWDTAQMRKISSDEEQKYDDAFSLQKVEDDHLQIFNYVAGAVPFIVRLVKSYDEQQSQRKVSARDRWKKAHTAVTKGLSVMEAHKTQKALMELADFLLVDSIPNKDRQKLLRNLRIVDLLMRFLRTPIGNLTERPHIYSIIRACYGLLTTYMSGSGRKNKFYMAQYMAFFYKQLNLPGELGLSVVQMLCYLIKDNRRLMSTLRQKDIDTFIKFLCFNRTHHYLDALSVLCVCDDVAIPDNQGYIVDKLIRHEQNSRGLITLDIEKSDGSASLPSVVFIHSPHLDQRLPLVQYITNYSAEHWFKAEYRFLIRQLEFLGKLCYGGNRYCIKTITELSSQLSWEQAFSCLRNENLPPDLRAEYCSLIIGLFVNTGTALTAVDRMGLSFVYDRVNLKTQKGEKAANKRHQRGGVNCHKSLTEELSSVVHANFDTLHSWIAQFLREKKYMIADNQGESKLIAQVMRLLQNLVELGFYGDAVDIQELTRPLMELLDGRTDKPFKGDRHDMPLVFDYYHKSGRYIADANTNALLEAKLRALDVIELLFTFQYNRSLEEFVSLFKNTNERSHSGKDRSVIEPMLSVDFNPFTKDDHVTKIALRKLDKLIDEAFYFSKKEFTEIMLDLSTYENDSIRVKSMAMMNKFFSARHELFRRAEQAQVLVTESSVRIHLQTQSDIVTCRKLTKQKLNTDQCRQLTEIFQRMERYCRLHGYKDRAHPMNQRILTNHGLLSILFDILADAGGRDLENESVEQVETIRWALLLLKSLCSSNNFVQRRVYERLDMLMSLQGVEQELAEALRAAFIACESLCLRIPAHVLQKIVILTAYKREKAWALLLLQRTLVKVDEVDLPLKRNQMLIMKYIMQNYHRVAYCLKQDRKIKVAFLKRSYGLDHLSYILALVDLLATCAEGENRFIESLCQKFVPLDELLWILAQPDIHCNTKIPFGKYLIWVYLNTGGSLIESGTAELPHNRNLWIFFESLVDILMISRGCCIEQPDSVGLLLSKRPSQIDQPSVSDVSGNSKAEVLRCRLHFIMETAMPIVMSFFRKFYSPDKDIYSTEEPIVDKLAFELVEFCRVIIRYLTRPSHTKSLVAAVLQLLPKSNLPAKLLEEILGLFSDPNHFQQHSVDEDLVYEQYKQEYANEEDLNKRLHTFAINFKKVYGGANTVVAQLRHKYTVSRRAAQREYSEKGVNEELPLGEEFQNFIHCFIDADAKDPKSKYALVGKLTEQLTISFKQNQNSDKLRIDQEALDVKCLQLLRAMIHNEERLLPLHWEESSPYVQRQLVKIKDMQAVFNQQDALPKILPHLARKNEQIVREVLAYLSAMLFNANRDSQQCMLNFFLSTREESFFYAIKQRMVVSASATKERRSLISQNNKDSKFLEYSSHTDGSLQETMDMGKQILERVQHLEDTARKRRLRQTSMFEKNRPGNLVCQRDRAHGDDSMSLPQMRHHQSVSQLSTDHRTLSVETVHLDDVFVREPFKRRSYNLNEINSARPNSGRPSSGVFFNNSSSSLQLISQQKSLNKSINDSFDTIDYNMKEGLLIKSNGSKEVEEQEFVDDEDELVSSGTDDGYIGLVLKVLARMCDGQYTELQNYLREQPDNIKSFNIVAETVQYLSLIYANLTASSVDLLISFLDSLNELVSGNQENRVVAFDNKLIDYINFILRAGQFSQCSLEQALNLLAIIGDLLMSLIEESSPAALEIANEIAECLDKSALARMMTECYILSRPRDKSKLAQAKKLAQKKKEKMKKKMTSLTSFGEGKSSLMTNLMEQMQFDEMSGVDEDAASSIPVDVENVTKEDRKELISVGYKFYFLLQRFQDINPRLKRSEVSLDELRAVSFYQKNSMSVEIMKDGYLQRLRFRVLNKNVLRKEVKDKLLWEVDRTSGAAKIRDLMAWNEDIQKDIWYQRKVLNKKICAVFMKFWLFWNYMAIILSLAINVIMLTTWEAAAVRQHQGTDHSTASDLPSNITDPIPKITVLTQNQYDVIIKILGFTHVGFSALVLISYFLLNHPRLPRFTPLRILFTKLCEKKRTNGAESVSRDEQDEDEEDEEVDVDRMEEHKSKLDVYLFSFQTIYYMGFMGLSLLGALWQKEYFFAFHLLNIVNNNQLLNRVIRAVTLNGMSLLWVGILGLVIIYIFSLVAFAFLRPAFHDMESNFYCSTLYQCFVTTTRYGLIGDMFENLPIPPAEHGNFNRFLAYSGFSVLFFIFITTIGLNIIFGIIVDTFSELRDLKWNSERDMKTTCFICSRPAYDFEHHARGFIYHVNQEHSMWAYIYFFVHLGDTKVNDLTALELHVHKLLEQKKYDFFPLNKAMSLECVEKEDEDTKVEEILSTVKRLQKWQEEEESNRAREHELRRQREWEEENRSFFEDSIDVPELQEQDSSSLHPQMLSVSDSSQSVSPRPSERVIDEVFGQGSSAALHRQDSTASDTGSFVWSPPSSVPVSPVPPVQIHTHVEDDTQDEEDTSL